MLRKISNYYSLFFLIFPLLSFYVGNRKELELGVLYTPLLIVIAAFVLIYLGLNFIIKNKAQTNLIITSIALYLFSYGSYLGQTDYKGSKAFWIYTAAFAIIFSVFYRLRKNKNLSVFLTIIGIYLIVSSLFSIISYEVQRKSFSSVSDQIGSSIPKPTLSNRPDVYYLIFDRYANSQVLLKYFKLDNKEFVKALQSRGFYVAEDSFANYPKTHLSLASSLNLDYLDKFAKKVGTENSDYTPAFDAVRNNKVAKYFKSLGYQYIYFGDWWGPTTYSHTADKNINLYLNSDEFVRKFLQSTVFSSLLGKYYRGNKLFGFFQDRIYENTNYKFEQLGQIATSKSPKFIFAHMLMPHHPYIFDADCRKVENDRKVSFETKIREQHLCTNKKIIKMLDEILKNSKEPPIIILQSDEGPFKLDEMKSDGQGIDWTKVSEDAIEMHMKILNAYYLPKQDYSKLYQTISPVNSFRLIFSQYFGANLKLLQDRSYFIPHLDRPYSYYEITDHLLK